MKGHVYPANKYLLKFSNRNAKKRFAICLKFKIKKPERPHWRRSGVFIRKFKHIPNLSGVSIVGFEKQIYSLHVGAL